MSNSKLAFSGIATKRMSRFYLPEDLVRKILLNLPVKSIVKCTIVCREWYSLIKSQFFISTHLKNSKRNKASNDCLLVYWHSSEAEERYSLHCDHRDFNNFLPLPLLPDVSCHEDWHWNFVVGSCNGLLLVVHSHGNVYNSAFCFLWNPLIRKSLFLPKPITLLWTKEKKLLLKELFGLGFDSAKNDYKVLRIVQLSDEVTSEIQLVSFQLYSLSQGYWRFLHNYGSEREVVVGCYNSPIAFVNGSFHYVGGFEIVQSSSDSDSSDSSDVEHCSFVEAFDVRHEIFCRIQLPESIQGTAASELSVWVYRDSTIAVFEHNSTANQFSLWVMKKYRVENSWTKLLTVNENPRLILEVYAFAAFRKNGELILKAAVPGDEDFGTEIVIYNPKTRQFRELCHWLNYNSVRIYSYVRTLVLLDVGNNANAEKRCNQYSCSIESLGKSHFAD